MSVYDGYPSYRKKVDDFLFQYDYIDIDYNNAYKHYAKNEEVPIGGCSVLKVDNLVGRQLDWLYSNMADAVVRTPKFGYRLHSVIGMAGGFSNFTNDNGATTIDRELLKTLPFQLQDGMNESGLFACYNVVPTDFGENIVEPAIEKKVELDALMIVRYILDNFDNATDAVEYIRDYAKITFPEALHNRDYELHIFVTDKLTTNKTYVLEFINNSTVVVDISDTPYLTNFYRYGVTLNADGTVYTPATQTDSADAITTNGITIHGAGLERFNLIVDTYPEIEDKNDLRNFLNELMYTRMYSSSPNPADPAWLTEYVGGDLHVNSAVTDFSEAVSEAAVEYSDRDRNDPKTWQTVHSVIYDLENLKIYVVAQESSVEYSFDIKNTIDTPESDVVSIIDQVNKMRFDNPVEELVPISRVENYLAVIGGFENAQLPLRPVSRVEKYLDYIAKHPGLSNPMTSAGDIIVGGENGVPVRLGKGSNGQVFKIDENGDPSWGDQSCGGVVIQAESNKTVNNVQVPNLTDAQLLAIYNATVAGQSVTITDATGMMHFSGVTADMVSDEVFVSFVYFKDMILEYGEGGVTAFKAIGGEHLYAHNIYVYTTDLRITFRIINNSSTPFSSRNLQEYLYEYYPDIGLSINASGVYARSDYGTICGVYGESTNTIGFLYFSAVEEYIDYGSKMLTSSHVTDTVTQIL